MAKAYSVDLREKAVAFVDEGHSCREAARALGVSPSFVIKLMERRRKTGSVEPAKRGGKGSKLDPHRTFLLSAVEAEPGLTMPELSERLMRERGVLAAPAMISRYLVRLGMPRKARRALLRRASTEQVVAAAEQQGLSGASRMGPDRF